MMEKDVSLMRSRRTIIGALNGIPENTVETSHALLLDYAHW